MKLPLRFLPYVLALLLLVGCWWFFYPTRWILPKTPRIRGTSDAEAPFHPDPSRPAWLVKPGSDHHPLPSSQR